MVIVHSNAPRLLSLKRLEAQKNRNITTTEVIIEKP
jgi:hypothetical protein